MNSKKNSIALTNNELNEIKEFVKKVKKLKSEGSTTAGVPGFLTPKAFTGDEDGEGATDLKRITHATAYDKKAPETRKHSIDLHEVNYNEFKSDETRSTIQKVNESIIDINRKLREINTLISHAHKLKLESNMDDSMHWKKTNEALLKISKRMNEVAQKTRKFANLREIEKQLNDTKVDRIVTQLQAFGLDVEKIEDGDGFDVFVNNEPIAFDVIGNEIKSDRGEVVGNINDKDIAQKIISKLS